MPIINNYDPPTGSGGTVTGGSFNNAPYSFSLTTFLLIPPNEKFLLIPAKQESREITLTFSFPVDLYFGSDLIPFKTLTTSEGFKDNQLGVDLWVKTLESDCQCLLIIRSEKPIDYIGGNTTPTPTPTPSPTPTPEIILSPDQLTAYINTNSFSNPSATIEYSAILPNPETIPGYQFKMSIDAKDDFRNLLGSYFVSFNGYPTNVGEMIISFQPSNSNQIFFDLLDEYNPSIRLKILNLDLINKIFTLGV